MIGNLAVKKGGYHGLICLVILSILLPGCASSTPMLSPPPTPQVVRIALPPSLTSYEKSIYTCADTLPGLAVFIEEIPASYEERSEFDLSITYGLSSEASGFTYQIKEEQLNILVNPANPVEKIAQQALAGIYQGTIKQWDEADPLAGFHQAIQVINYPSDSDLGGFLSSVINPQASRSIEALIVPTPKEMLAQVGVQTGAIGFAPSSWLDGTDKVKILTTDPQLSEKLRLPVLITAQEEPQGVLAALLDCLQ